MASPDLAMLTFEDAAAFEDWLATQPDNAPGVWLRFAKQGSAETTLTKSDAIDCALAHGWIDGQLGSIDATAFKTRFTPRRPRSAWSRINRQRAERLMVAGRMTARGLAQVALAKSDGRWANAYEGSAKAVPGAELQAALDAAPAARAFFEQLDAANRYAVLYRVQQAKTPKKRAAKIAELVAMLSRGEAFHPKRRLRG